MQLARDFGDEIIHGDMLSYKSVGIMGIMVTFPNLELEYLECILLLLSLQHKVGDGMTDHLINELTT